MKRALQLEPISVNVFRATVDKAGNVDRLFGGQLIGHAVVAAYKTLPEGWHLHSMHGYYARYGRVKDPIDFEVERIRDGRTFANRYVLGRQHGEIILTCQCSFQKTAVHSSSVYLAPSFPSHIPPPEQLGPGFQLPDGIQPNANQKVLLRIISAVELFLPDSIQCRGALPGIHIPLPDDGKHRLYIWMRNKELDTDPVSTICSLVFMSDLMMIWCGMQSIEVKNNRDHTSLDHALWINEFDVSFNDWILYEQETLVNSLERVLVSGRMWTKEGRLILSTMQEGLIRMKAKV